MTGPMSDDERRKMVKRAFKATPESRDHLLKKANRQTRWLIRDNRRKGNGCAVTALGLATCAARWRGWGT